MVFETIRGRANEQNSGRRANGGSETKKMKLSKELSEKEGRNPLNGSCFRALLLLPQRTLGREKKPQSRPRVTNYAKGILPRKKGSEKWAMICSECYSVAWSTVEYGHGILLFYLGRKRIFI